MQQEIQLAGLSCQNCAHHVEVAFSKLPKVAQVTVNLEDSVAHVDTQESYSQDQYQEALGPLPYKVVGLAGGK
ncbi:heavy-metal-associated domain-containing protein [Streptococcus danieliae]|uniref:Heavy-metal-associated domain-containing protein n=1 Tax=Streptococcus danieliae TaxID=747656 RepID=A0A7Z0LBU5_9STRE|nr:heavy metal-associated domain-containing protein [Streptococcus danieliae]MBF0716568.1 heavy-metal-associated domain-containing protein [Streptococcus danieliae]NYS48498.1 heavy-metal-associated domain-containing protein [Streptococcus danieliae]